MKNLIKNHKKIFYIFMVFNMLVPLVNIAFAYTIKLIIDSGLSQSLTALKKSIIFGVFVILSYAILNFISFRLRNRLVRHIMGDYNHRVFQSILDKDYKDFSDENSGKFISVLTDNMKKIEEDYLYQFFNISKNLSLMIFSLIAMFIGNWLLTTFVVIASMIPMAISGMVGKKTVTLQKSLLHSEQQYLAKVKDILLGFLVIKSFNVKEVVTKDFIQEREKLSTVQASKDKFDILARVLSELSGMLVFLVAFGGGMLLVFKGQTTIGSVTAIVQLVNFVVLPLNEIGMGMSQFRQGETTLKSIELSNEKVISNGQFKKHFDDSITFSDVDFSYDKNDVKVLSNLSFEIEKGEKIALVGMSGSGKSTLLNILLRFFDTDSGVIKIDNEKLENLSSESIYQLMTIVQQNVYVFDDTLRANITLNEVFSDEEINAAVQLSGLSDVVSNSDLKLETNCGENGANLSGGQKQRLCIARALIRQTPILLLDEATSSLDNRVTVEIENAILNIKNLTSIIVTHKLNESLLKKYNRIFFMKNGKIVETGKFEDLLNKKGEFYNLFKLSM